MSAATAFRVLRVVGLLALLGLGWWVAAPAAIGGQSALVTVVGRSMEPGLHGGDLVVLRASDAYAVGDVVGYRSDRLDRVVLHRIVAEEDGRFRLQGDNNDWLDPDTPSPDEVVGRQLIHFPKGGAILEHTTPWVLGVLALVLVLSGGRRVRRRRRQRSPVEGSVVDARVPGHRARRPDIRPTPSRLLVPALVSVVVAGCVVSAGAAVALAVAPRSQGGEHQPSTTGERTLTFSYRTDVRRSPAYDGTIVVSPQPVFRAVADTVDVAYHYSGPRGTLSLAVELSMPGGWRSRVPLRRIVPLAEDATGTVVLRLDDLDRRARRASAVTGLAASEVGVTVVADVTSPGAPDFAAELPLTMSAQRLALVADEEGRGSGTVVERQDVPPATTPTGTVVAGQDVHRDVLRLAVGAAALLALGAAAGLALLLRRRLTAGDVGLIRRRYARLLVEVEPVELRAPVVEVTTFPTLARLADRGGLPVLHFSRGGMHTFTVRDEGATYRFRVGASAAAEPIDPPGPSEPANQEHVVA